MRRHFAWGTGDLILRGVAKKCGDLAEMFEQQQQERLLRAAEAEAQGQPLAALRLERLASESEHEARA